MLLEVVRVKSLASAGPWVEQLAVPLAKQPAVTSVGELARSLVCCRLVVAGR